jgi:methyl-accepting chemotaxis protein
MAKSLGDIVSSKSDTTLHKLANTLKEELSFSEHASGQVQEEALFTKKTAEYIRKKGKEVIDIAEKLKVLALNTAIEATKVGKSGKGVGIISEQMKSISDTTRKTLKEVFDKSRELSLSSEKVLETSGKLRSSASDLKEESSILFKTSLKITDQKDELAGLVRMSIDEIAQDQEDLNNIFLLIKKDQEKD